MAVFPPSCTKKRRCISSGACEQTYAIGRAAAVRGPCAPFPTECRVLRVYIAKITFTTLIDHFTSLDAESSLVLSDQLIKLELLTQSIRQQKLPPHAVRFAAFDPAVRMALAGVRGTAAVASCFGKTLYIIPIETPHFIRNHSACQSFFDEILASQHGKNSRLVHGLHNDEQNRREVRQFRDQQMFLLKNQEITFPTRLV